MNPVLIKPEGNATSQLVSMGKMVGKLRAYEFMTRREVLWQTIKDSLDTLRSRFDVRSRFDIVVIEGAGSPAEINLRAPDIVNMEVALYARTFAGNTRCCGLFLDDIDNASPFATAYVP